MRRGDTALKTRGKPPCFWLWPLALFLWAAVSIEAQGQDVVPSQVNIIPLSLNPALAGNGHRMAAGLVHRSQWKSAGVPFVTNAVSFDMRVGSGQQDQGGLGIGVYFINDRAGDPAFTTNQFNTALAYTLPLDDRSTLAAGLSLAFDQRGVSLGGGQWASQYNGTHHDPSMASGEAFADDRMSVLHAGIGMVYTLSNPKGSRNAGNFNLKIGASAHQLGHIDIVDATYLDHEFSERYAGFAILETDLGSGGFGIEPALYYFRQGQFDLLMLGGYIRYAIIEGSTFSQRAKPLYAALGGFSRVGDAVVVAAKVDWAEFTFGFSYDFSVSELTAVMPRMGAWEVGIAWRMD